MDRLSDDIISFYSKIDFKGKLPPGISIMNPFKDNPRILQVISRFYRKYYNDHNKRYMVLGINPGRFGAGITGIPFTDTKRLKEKCGIEISGFDTHEISSVFVYEMIDRFGGPERFYRNFYISAICPLGFTSNTRKGRQINYNYYDNPKLTDAVYDFIITGLRVQLGFSIRSEACFCLGTGKNLSFLSGINNKHHFFDKIIPLEHPRFIMQYKSKMKSEYIEKYLSEFNTVLK